MGERWVQNLHEQLHKYKEVYERHVNYQKSSIEWI